MLVDEVTSLCWDPMDGNYSKTSVYKILNTVQEKNIIILVSQIISRITLLP